MYTVCPLGLSLTLTKAKTGCKKCGGVSARKHTGRRTLTHRNVRLFVLLLPTHILEFSNFLWGKKGFETIKCFGEIKSTKTYYLFLFLFPPSTDNVLCSIPNANYNKW